MNQLFLITLMVSTVFISCVSSVSLQGKNNDFSGNVPAQERSKRQLDLTAILIQAAKDFILGGGVETIKGSPDKMNALTSFVKQSAVRQVLGDGLVGRVLGGNLLGRQPTTQAPGGVLGMLFGGSKTTPRPSESAATKPGFLSSLLSRFTGSGSGSGSQKTAPVSGPAVHTGADSEITGGGGSPSSGSSSSGSSLLALAKKFLS